MKIGRTKARLISELTIDADIAMATHKLTGLGAGSAAGESLRYQQVIGVYLPLAGGTLTGDLSIGANKLKTTNHSIKEESASVLGIYEDDGVTRSQLSCSYFHPYESILFGANDKSIDTPYVNDHYLKLRARINDGAVADVARLQNAASPYFEAILPMRLTPASAPGTPVEGHFYYDATDDILKFRDSGAWRDIFNEGAYMVMQAVKGQTTYVDNGAILIFTIPAGSIVLACMMKITTIYNGVHTLIVGDATDPDGLLTSVDPSGYGAVWLPTDYAGFGDYLYLDAAGHYVPKLYTAETAINITSTPSAATKGEADVYIIYMKLH